MPPKFQEVDASFRYDQLRLEIINCLSKYVARGGGGSLTELKDRFRGKLSQQQNSTQARRKIRNVKQLVAVLEKNGVIGPYNVKFIKTVAEEVGLTELVGKIKKFERDSFGIINKAVLLAKDLKDGMWQMLKGGAKKTALKLKAVLTSKGFKTVIFASTLLALNHRNPELIRNLKPFLDLAIEVVDMVSGSVIFVLNITSISSLNRLWQSYKDGSLTTNLKKEFNEIEELKEAIGKEIDVEITINEEEYREVQWNLILLKMEAKNESNQNSMKEPERKRRYSMCCEREIPKVSVEPLDVTQLQILLRNVTRLDQVLDNLQSEEKETLIKMRRELSEVISFSGSSINVVGDSLVDYKAQASGSSQLTTQPSALVANHDPKSDSAHSSPRVVQKKIKVKQRQLRSLQGKRSHSRGYKGEKQDEEFENDPHKKAHLRTKTQRDKMNRKERKKRKRSHSRGYKGEKQDEEFENDPHKKAHLRTKTQRDKMNRFMMEHTGK